MKLKVLLENLPQKFSLSNDESEIEIVDVTTDPDKCKPGVLYVAAVGETVLADQYGTRVDGRDYIDRAISNGASAVLTTDTTNEASNFPIITFDKPLMLLGKLCQVLYNTAKPKALALVTGTNGKTSVVQFTSQIWTSSEIANCSFGNLGGVLSTGESIWERDHVLSVPETVAFHKMLNQLPSKNIKHVVMEATSHALFDYRLSDGGANIGAFTNLTRDHLDFHKTLEEYFRVKMTLFGEVLPRQSIAILNADSPYFDKASLICKNQNHQIVSFGRAGADIKLVQIESSSSEQLLSLEIYGKPYKVDFGLVGEFQVSNALCSLAIATNSDVSVDKAIESLGKLKPVEGRLITVANTKSGGKVVVDFAHTPDGLKAALSALKLTTKGALTVVFGCNGDRDIGKRKDMGAIASSMADNVIVTDGHPRNEDPEKIRKDVLAGADSALEIAGRKEAIIEALNSMNESDTILIAGLGHLNYQIIKEDMIPISEESIVIQTLQELGKI